MSRARPRYCRRQSRWLQWALGSRRNFGQHQRQSLFTAAGVRAATPLDATRQRRNGPGPGPRRATCRPGGISAAGDGRRLDLPRSSTRFTCGVPLAPRAALMPLAFNPAAICRREAAPATFKSSMIGTRLEARLLDLATRRPRGFWPHLWLGTDRLPRSPPSNWPHMAGQKGERMLLPKTGAFRVITNWLLRQAERAE